MSKINTRQHQTVSLYTRYVDKLTKSLDVEWHVEPIGLRFLVKLYPIFLQQISIKDRARYKFEKFTETPRGVAKVKIKCDQRSDSD